MTNPEKRAKKQFEGKDDQYVKDIFTSTSDAIKNDCFGSHDMTLNMLSSIELGSRGYTIKTIKTVSIEKTTN